MPRRHQPQQDEQQLAADTLAGRHGPLVHARHVAAVLACSTRTVYDRVDSLPVQPVRLGGTLRWRVQDLREVCGLPPLQDLPGAAAPADPGTAPARLVRS